MLALTLGKGGALHSLPASIFPLPAREHCPKKVMLEEAGGQLVKEIHISENRITPGPYICIVRLSGD